MHVHLTVPPTTTAPVSGQVNSTEVLVEDGQVVQNSGGRVTDDGVGRALTHGGLEQQPVRRQGIHRFGHGSRIRATANSGELTRADQPRDLRRIDALSG